jgi:hypothetical protein
MKIDDCRKIAGFKWNKKKDLVAELLSAGYSIEQVAIKSGVSERSIYYYKNRPEFEEEVDRLTLMVDVAARAGRVRMAKRIVREREQAVEARNKEIAEGKPVKPLELSEKDILDWLKFIQSETDGARLFTGEQIDTMVSLYNQNYISSQSRD